MTSTTTRTTAALAAATLFMLVIAGSAVAATQTWYILSDQTATHVAPSGAGSSTTIPGTNTHVVWVATHAATVDTAFPAAQWGFGVASFTGSFQLEVGIWDGSNFYSKGEKGVPIKGGNTISVSAFTVPAGDYLAFAARDNKEDSASITVSNPGTYFVSPSIDPGYPTPELTTILLTLVGLGAVGLFVVSRRK